MSDPRSPRVRSAEETILDLHAKIESDAKVIAALRDALEMTAGRRQCMDNPMSNAAIRRIKCYLFHWNRQWLGLGWWQCKRCGEKWFR